jgi:hypothetical protein
MGRSSSIKRHWDAKKGGTGGSVSMESSSRNNTLVEFPSSGMDSSVLKRKKRRHS